MNLIGFCLEIPLWLEQKHTSVCLETVWTCKCECVCEGEWGGGTLNSGHLIMAIRLYNIIFFFLFLENSNLK